MRPFNILLVEDNKGDVLLVTEALSESSLVYRHDVVNDGKAALDYLLKEKPYQNQLSPDLILLDLNIPKYSGLEVLKIVKQNKDLKAIPVIIMTTSSAEQDISICYSNYANCYITKPRDTAGFSTTIAKIEKFWLDFAQIPNTQNHESDR